MRDCKYLDKDLQKYNKLKLWHLAKNASHLLLFLHGNLQQLPQLNTFLSLLLACKQS